MKTFFCLFLIYQDFLLEDTQKSVFSYELSNYSKFHPKKDIQYMYFL